MPTISNVGSGLNGSSVGTPQVSPTTGVLVVSPSRTYVVPVDYSLPPGESPLVPIWERSEDAVLDYSIDWSTWLDIQGATVVSLSVDLPSTLTLVTQKKVSAVHSVVISGGFAGGTVSKDHRVDFHINFNAPDPRRETRSVIFRVQRIR